MQHKPSLEVAKYAVRLKICPGCYQRPPGSETLGPMVARRCEPDCTIFNSLLLMQTALACAPDDMAPDSVMKKFVCPSCQASATAGDFCEDRLTRSCPLSRYAADLLAILDDVARAAAGHKAEQK